MHRSKSLEVLIPTLYLKGVSTGAFEEALVALLGKDAGGLSAATVGRLKEAWSEEHARWSKCDLSAKRYVYFWVDGIHVQAGLEDAAQNAAAIPGNTSGLVVLKPLAPRQPGQNLPFFFVQIRRNDACDRLADHLACFVAEDTRGAGVPRGDCSIESLGDNRIVR
jgi:Transposase, Mutator family